MQLRDLANEAEYLWLAPRRPPKSGGNDGGGRRPSHNPLLPSAPRSVVA